jgi:iron complex outermembrane recepter protein
MKKLSFFGALLCASLSVYSQFNISGIVKDVDGSPLAGANIQIDNTYKGAVSGSNGEFSVRSLGKGPYNLRISYLAHETAIMKVDLLDKDVYLDILLKSSPILTDEVVITALRASNSTPMAFTNMDKSQIHEQNVGQDIPYILNLTPSVVGWSDAGNGVGYTYLRIRGTDMSRINITLNGIPLNDPESQNVWWVDLPDMASSVDNVQIQRGVGTSSNGAGAFGATLNFQTNGLSKEPYAEISSSYGSFNTMKNTFMAGSGLLNNKLSFDARISEISSDGYIRHSVTELRSYFLSGSYNGENDLVKVNVFSGTEKTDLAWDGVPDTLLNKDRRYNGLGLYTDAQGHQKYYDDETDNYKQSHFQIFYSRRMNNFLNANLAFHYTKGKGYYEEYKQEQDFSGFGLANPVINGDTLTSSDVITRKWLSNNFYGITYSLNYKKERLDASLGGAWNEYDGSNYGNLIWAQNASELPVNFEWYDGSSVKKDFNIFGKANLKLFDQVNLYGDLQYRQIDYSIKGTDNDLRNITQTHVFNFLNPKAGLYFNLNNGQSAYFSFAVAHREPNRDNFVDADSGKRPTYETLLDYEAGYNFKSKRLQVGVNFYYMDYNDQLVLTGQINDVGSAIMMNVPNSYRTGIELMAGISILPDLEWDLNATFSQNKILHFTEFIDNWDTGGQDTVKHGKTNIAFSPDIVGSSRITYEPLQNLRFSLQSKYVGKQYIDNSSDSHYTLKQYFVNDAKVSYKFKSGWFKSLEIFVQANNIFNIKYETNAWLYKYNEASTTSGLTGTTTQNMNGFSPQAGINYMTGFSVKF